MTATDAPRPLLSVVVPCYNEEEVLGEFHARLLRVLNDIPDLDHELIYVEDGSQDGTFELLEGLQRESAKVRVLRLSRNFGHQVAITAGLEASVGDAVVVIDADLQDPPAIVAEMVARWRGGADVAYGVRLARAGDGPVKRWTARLFYFVLAKFSNHSMPRQAGEFRLMDRRVVDAVLALPERDRLTRALVSWVGFRQEAVYFNRDPRFAGKSKFPLGQALRLAVDGLLSFSLVPLRLASWLGFVAALLAFAGICHAVAVRLLTDTWVPGWAALVIAVLFVGGVQLMVIGLLGEYVGRIYGEVKRRPLYFVADRLGFPDADAGAASAGRAEPNDLNGRAMRGNQAPAHPAAGRRAR